MTHRNISQGLRAKAFLTMTAVLVMLVGMLSASAPAAQMGAQAAPPPPPPPQQGWQQGMVH